MPVVLRERGYRVEFYASDGSERRHVHVKKNAKHAKVWLEPEVELEFSRRYKPHEVNDVLRFVQRHPKSFWRRGMTFLAELEQTVRATSVRVTNDTITVDLEDGRTVAVPTAWFPRLLHATPKERANYQIDDEGVIWPDVEADFSVRGLLLGRKSGESAESFKFWLDNRKRGRRVTVEQWLKVKRRERQRGSARPQARRGTLKKAK